jgi:uncharacterized protein YjiS (DUF1127 family)
MLPEASPPSRRCPRPSSTASCAGSRRARALRRQRTRLLDLDAHMLRDIGLHRGRSPAEARRALWDVPDRWRR